MRRPEAVLVAGAALWGLSWVFLAWLSSAGVRGMPAVLYCFGLLSVVSMPVLFIQQRQWWAQRWPMLMICVCGGWATAGLVGALSEGDVVRAMLLFYLAPVWSLLGGWAFLGEVLNKRRIGVLVLAMSGIGLTLGISAETFKPLTITDWLAFSAGIAFAINNLATRAADQVPMASKILVNFPGAAFWGGIFCLLLGSQLPAFAWAEMSGPIVAFGIFWLVSMGSAQYGFSYIEAGRAGVLVVIELVVAVLTACWLGERELGLREWCGGVLVLVAALLAAQPSAPAPRALAEAKA